MHMLEVLKIRTTSIINLCTDCVRSKGHADSMHQRISLFLRRVFEFDKEDFLWT